MSYTKTNWRDGDVITAAKMNKIENGIESANSGSGSGGGRIIELTSGLSEGTFLPIEPNLPMEYFAGACLGFNGQYSIIKRVLEEYDGQGNVIGYEFIIETATFVYTLSNGNIYIAD